MKLLDIEPGNLNRELALKICRNKKLKREYICKYKEHFRGGSTTHDDVRAAAAADAIFKNVPKDPLKILVLCADTKTIYSGKWFNIIRDIFRNSIDHILLHNKIEITFFGIRIPTLGSVSKPDALKTVDISYKYVQAYTQMTEDLKGFEPAILEKMIQENKYFIIINEYCPIYIFNKISTEFFNSLFITPYEIPKLLTDADATHEIIVQKNLPTSPEKSLYLVIKKLELKNLN
jgi:hypothetical protein